VRKFWKLTTAACAAVVVASVGAGAAGAITAPPAGYGFDGHPDVIVAGGSDTTAKVMLSLENLWNGSAINNGCHHSQNTTATTTPTTIANDPNPGHVFQNACDQQDEPFNLSNYDGDTLAMANPTGSGAGRQALEGLNGGHYEGTVNILSNPGRTDGNVLFHANSAIVQDDAITNADVGKLISGTGDPKVPSPAYVGTILANTPVGHTSFTISATPNSQQDDPYQNSVDSAALSMTVSRYGCIAPGPTGGPVPDIGRSSSVAGGLSGCTNSQSGTTAAAEFGASTFWGYAHDSVEVYGIHDSSNPAASQNSDKLNNLSNLTANQLDDIWSDHDGTNNGPLCPGSSTKHYMTWGQLDPVWTGDPYQNSPIVPWKMNTGSGTYGTFRDYVRNNTSPADAAFDPSSNSLDPCARTLDIGTTGVGNDGTTNGSAFALENDLKPLLNVPGQQGSALNNTPSSVNNPQNWINWASFGVFSAFTYTSSAHCCPLSQTVGTTYNAIAAALQGQLPSSGLVSSYPIQRILWNVTRKGDADCPAKMTTVISPPSITRDCDFSGQPGPNGDLNVVGATGGPGGAVREFIRFLCRVDSTKQGTDPFTGKNYDAEITSAIVAAGFTIVPAASRTSGSRCDVNTQVVKQ
jgi:ABC-type phosphate transport system substrate-binding protein